VVKFTLLFLVVIFFACSQSYEKSYTDLESAFTDWYFKFHPIESTFFGGATQYDSTFPRLDVDAREEYLADVQRFHIELSQIDETKLPETEYVNYMILTEFLSDEVFSLQKSKRYQWDASLYPEIMYNGFVALVDLDYLQMSSRTKAIAFRLEASGTVLDYARENLKFYDKSTVKYADRIIESITLLLDELPMKIMSDNNTMDKIDNHIKILRHNLKYYGQWMRDDYSELEKYNIEKKPSEISELFSHIVGKDYAIGKVSLLAEKRMHKIQDQLFNLSLPIYLRENDEPVWVDRDDSLSVIYWVKDELDNHSINPQEYISSIYAASKKVHDELNGNRELYINSIPNIQIRFDNEYSISPSIARVGRFQLNGKNKEVEYLVKPLETLQLLKINMNRYELDILIMKDLSPGNLQFQQSLSKNSQLLRQIIQNDVTKFGWQYYASSYLINSGFGGSENYAYKLTSLYNALKIAGLSWMEIQLGYHEADENDIIIDLAIKINISESEANQYVTNGSQSPFHYTQQFIGSVEMDRLQTDYKRKNKNIMNLREFHSRILMEGCIPISQLRKMILN